MTDDRLILIFCKELLGTREGNLVDVAVDLVGSHTDTTVADGECLVLLIGADVDRKVAQCALELALRREGFEFLRSIYSVRHQLAQEDFVI